MSRGGFMERVEALGEALAEAYLNGNLSYVRSALVKCGPLEGAALALTIYEALRDSEDRDRFAYAVSLWGAP